MPRVKREAFQNSNIPKPVDKGKGKVEKIKFPQELEEQVYRIWNGKPPLELIEKWKELGKSESDQLKYYNPGTKLARMNRIKVLIGYHSNLAGYCSECKNLNTYILKQKLEGAVILTRFCEEHVPKK